MRYGPLITETDVHCSSHSRMDLTLNTFLLRLDCCLLYIALVLLVQGMKPSMVGGLIADTPHPGGFPIRLLCIYRLSENFVGVGMFILPTTLLVCRLE